MKLLWQKRWKAGSQSDMTKHSDWFKKWFSNKMYLKIYRHRDDTDAKRLIDLIQRTIPTYSREKILDLACGAGRHSLELARRGFDVTGIDLSSYLISEAKKLVRTSPEQGLKVRFEIKDMRDFNYRGKFNLIVNLFTSFGYFENDEENFSVIQNVRNSLKPSGYFVLDFLNPVFLEKNLVKRSVKKYENMSVVQTRKIEDGFVEKKIKITEDNETSEYFERLRLFTDKEFSSMFKRSGFRIIKRAGDYFGNSYTENKSSRLIYFVQKI